jgi:hypothetical protein
MGGIDNRMVGTRLSDDSACDGMEHEILLRYEQEVRGNMHRDRNTPVDPKLATFGYPAVTARKGW